MDHDFERFEETIDALLRVADAGGASLGPDGGLVMLVRALSSAVVRKFDRTRETTLHDVEALCAFVLKAPWTQSFRSALARRDAVKNRPSA